MGHKRVLVRGVRPLSLSPPASLLTFPAASWHFPLNVPLVLFELSMLQSELIASSNPSYLSCFAFYWGHLTSTQPPRPADSRPFPWLLCLSSLCCFYFCCIFLVAFISTPPAQVFCPSYNSNCNLVTRELLFSIYPGNLSYRLLPETFSISIFDRSRVYSFHMMSSSSSSSFSSSSCLIFIEF